MECHLELKGNEPPPTKQFALRALEILAPALDLLFSDGVYIMPAESISFHAVPLLQYLQRRRMLMRIILVGAVLLVSCLCVVAQEPLAAVEKRVALSEKAVALDGGGAPAL
jgi:hypothetical protein